MPSPETPADEPPAAVRSPVPALESIRSALSAGIRYCQSFLKAAGVRDARLSEVSCTPDARDWLIAFGEHRFRMAIFTNGFSVRTLFADVRIPERD